MDIVFYAHNGSGLGHTRRVALLVDELADLEPNARIGVLTNCPNRLFLEASRTTVFASRTGVAPSSEILNSMERSL